MTKSLLMLKKSWEVTPKMNVGMKTLALMITKTALPV